MDNKLLSYKTPKTWLIIIVILVLIIVALGSFILYRHDYPKVEVRYIDRVITNERVVTVKEYVGEAGKWEVFEVTGYSANDPAQGTNNIVATTFNLDLNRVKNLPIIATDPDVIPLYSIVEIKGMGAYISLDTGGLIRENRIDILFDSKQEALNFGRKELLVRVIE
ncbi:MAG: 3D domain-containing protein [Atribacterota bacterium]|nr:3D domain-containing protein [Atribacterota bacterium]